MPIAIYIAVFSIAAAISLITTPLVVRLAHAVRIVDRPGTRKIHSTIVPRIGGLVLVVSMLAVIVPVLLLDSPVAEAFAQLRTKIVTLLACGVFIFLVGLVDDARGLSAGIKLILQIFAATAICMSGARIDHLVINPELSWTFSELSWPLTVLWIVGITNAVNLIDGLDGLAAGISAVTCAVISAFALYTGQMVMAVLMFTLLGSLAGFLVFNFNPAKIFLGDSGSMFLGFFLASASVMCPTKSYTLVALALPAVALGVPIFDTLFSMMRRTLNRRSMFAPDRGHIHHRIMDMGLSQRQAVLLMYAVTILAAGVGLFMMMTRDLFAVLIFIGALVPLIVMFRVFGAVRFRETLASMQRNRAMARQARQQQSGFEEMQLRLGETDSLDKWWLVIRRAARKLGMEKVALTITEPDGYSQTLQWNTPDQTTPSHKMIRVTIPFKDKRNDGVVRAEVELPAGESLESAGRQIALFGRLIDEYHIPSTKDTKT